MNMETNESRYILTSITADHHKVTDTKSGISVTFKDKQFEETQQWSQPVGKEFHPVALGRLCDKMEAWIKLNHPDKFSEPDKFVLTRSEDGQTITITKPAQGLVVSFPSSLGKATAAAKIRAVSMWLKNYADNWDNVDF